MRNLLTHFLLPCLILFSTSSCVQDCDEPDVERINSLLFELKQGGEDGFSQEALNSIYYVRYVAFSEPLIADTFYGNGNFPEGNGRFVINDQFPFRNSQTPYYTSYAYIVIDPTSDFAADIENVKLQGFYDGECGYTNTQKQFVLDGDTIDLAGSADFYLLTR